MDFLFQSLSEARRALEALPAPLIVFNKSLSGSRLLVGLLAAAGVFMGSERNESEDALPFLALVESLVVRHYPDYSELLHHPERQSETAMMLARALASHLRNYQGGPWGWKLCETTYILPVLAYLFPTARFIHLIRDGRDVAFSDHVAPKEPFWQKVFINTNRLPFWNGLFFGRHSRSTYRLFPHLYNIQHWSNSVGLGRRFGSMLGANCLEVRYEQLCLDFVTEARRVTEFAGLACGESEMAALAGTVSTARIGRYRRHSRFKVWQVTRRAAPLLAELGYLEGRRAHADL
jgi:hypothetical protein